MDSMTKPSLFSVIRYALFCAGICVGVLFVAAPFSCKLTEEGIEIISVDRTAPQILSFDFKQRSLLEMQCTEPITLKDVQFRKKGESDASAVSVSYNENRTAAAITLSAPTEIGVAYELTGIAEDLNGNTLTFSLPFTGYNDNLPVMIFNEIRGVSSSARTNPEYVELFVLAAGNTAGLEIVSGNYGKSKAYAFPAIDVSAGEYITVHYRHDTDTPDYCIDELGSDLTLATVHKNNDNCDGARDLWVENPMEAKWLTNMDVLVLTSENGKTIQDAVLYAPSGTTAWKTEDQVTFAAKAVAQGLWTDADPAHAACSDFMSAQRTLARQNTSLLAALAAEGSARAPSCAADWFITADKTASPGYENSNVPYKN